MNYFIDTHVHLDAPEYEHDIDSVINRALAAGVNKMVTIGASTGWESNYKALAIAGKYDFCWCTAGLHPHDANITIDIKKLEELCVKEKVVAIGETGLDFFKEYADIPNQKEWFEAHIHVAKNLRKPLIIHCRNAANEILEILLNNKANDIGGVFHCFVEDADFAKKLKDINFLISVPGIITFKKSESLREHIAKIPLEQMMLETDGPFLSPEPYRGKRNEPSFMIETAKIVAKIKDVDVDLVAKQTTKNALSFFRINE